jgi:altronate dehydratase large subunit
MSTNEFMGYRRADGRCGRAQSGGGSSFLRLFAHAASSSRPRCGGRCGDYNGGCSLTDVDVELAVQLLAQYGRHPNVVGSLVVSLGCETLNAVDLAARIAEGTAPTELLVIQELGGMRRTVEKGVALATRMVAAAADLRREPCPVSSLTIGLECGGSDATSGMAANPAMGVFSDLLAAQKARVILAETSELLGAEHVLAQRAADADVRTRLERTMVECERFLKSTGEDFIGKQPRPRQHPRRHHHGGRKRPGLMCSRAAAPRWWTAGLRRATHPAGPVVHGFAGQRPRSVTGLVAAGSQIVVFTTGRGKPHGQRHREPVIKVTANAATYARMGADMDVDASTIITGQETVAQGGQRILDFCLQVAGGQRTDAEILGHHEFDFAPRDRCTTVTKARVRRIQVWIGRPSQAH